MTDLSARQQALYELVQGSPYVEQLERWIELVWTWNRKLDLTAAKNEADLVELAVRDAAEVAAMIPKVDDPAIAPRRAIDVGSGFGAPGIGLAILRPDLSWVLAEPLGKRAAFLRTVVGSLGMVDRVEVVARKGQDLVGATAAPFDLAISRATMAPSDWLELGDRLAPQGEVIILLAREDTPYHPRRVVLDERVYATRSAAPRRAVRLGVGRPAEGWPAPRS